MQAPDGIRIDDKGRVWTAEGEGVVVHAADPKILGVFNAHFFTGDRVKTAIVQFELVEDKAVILGQDKLWIVKVELNTCLSIAQEAALGLNGSPKTSPFSVRHFLVAEGLWTAGSMCSFSRNSIKSVLGT
ncbi:hypothetical protein LTR47_011816 [Exophiala xenobiotica]|nr:hypothetical protein LTR92_011498 [Exophiala xenobiotica]KAK5214997.1 hypothetical protein LTR72_011914 [Exophiala xenobiotica]KAK5217845.1 hypothetical protein LTR47_011816 [Exophiala xenobiotica]KAK5281181.1 hypothetical protein LTR40_005255 [Exophiala xenobiotica]KAK5282799.1 hypothetical protein LTR14_011976 [Exophiala xenobiotica]